MTLTLKMTEPASIKNPQAYSILERVHQILGNMKEVEQKGKVE